MKISAWLVILIGFAPACAATTVDDPDVEEETVDESADEATGAALRFDFATMQCSSDPAAVCATDVEQCFCKNDFDTLNYSSQRHFVVVGTDKRKAEINAAGNYQAAYIDRLNEGWTQMSGAEHADQMMAELEQRMPSGVPKWVHLNEISAGTWPGNQAYRKHVIAVASRLRNHWNKNVVVYAPFANPGNHAVDWSALADVAWIGAELFLSGKEINAHGNSVDWCRAQYQSSIDDYGALGVPRSRLMIIEHFGQTLAVRTWGRAGVSDAGWVNAIKARSKAAQQLNFAGYITYAWAFNWMHETEAQRQHYMEVYRSFLLP